MPLQVTRAIWNLGTKLELFQTVHTWVTKWVRNSRLVITLWPQAPRPFQCSSCPWRFTTAIVQSSLKIVHAGTTSKGRIGFIWWYTAPTASLLQYSSLRQSYSYNNYSGTSAVLSRHLLGGRIGHKFVPGGDSFAVFLRNSQHLHASIGSF